MSRFLPPGSTIGMLGGGQLGRMFAREARRMGYRVVSWIGAPNSGPADLSDELIEDGFDSDVAFRRFRDAVDVASVEFENIPRSLLENLEGVVPLHPGAHAIATCQHREREKRFLAEGGFPCAPFAVIDSVESLAEALPKLPVGGGILKTAEFGYDGKGQLPVAPGDDAARVWSDFDAPRAVLEEKIELAGELSVLVMRSRDGLVASYDPAENIHRDHILDLSIVPARLEPRVLDEARSVASGIAEALNYVGLLAVEFFLSTSGRLLVNEMAPRPHNSGHHTIDACCTCQFEQQLRCLVGAEIGSPRLHSPAVMLNLLGDVWIDAGGKPPWEQILALPGAHLHLYGKREPRPGRKMGHLTFTGLELDGVLAEQDRARELLRIPPLG